MNVNKEIPFGIIKELLSDEYVKRFDLFAFKLTIAKNAQRFVSCPTPECGYIVWVEENDLKINPYFMCPSCKIEYCLEWEAEYHVETDCATYQRRYGKGKLDFGDKAAIDHALENKMQKCPDWRMWVMKIIGWDAMVCYCGAGFWYRWGTKYNDAHVWRCGF